MNRQRPDAPRDHQQRLSEVGVDAVGSVGAADAMIRTALATGAGVRIVPSGVGLSDGVGALRWSSS